MNRLLTKHRLLTLAAVASALLIAAMPSLFRGMSSRAHLFELAIHLNELELRETRVSERILRARTGYELPWGALIEATSALQRETETVARLLEAPSLMSRPELQRAFGEYRRHTEDRIVAVETVAAEYAALRRALSQLTEQEALGDPAVEAVTANVLAYLRHPDRRLREPLIAEIARLPEVARIASPADAEAAQHAARTAIDQRDRVAELAAAALSERADSSLAVARALVASGVPAARRREDAVSTALVGLSGVLLLAVIWGGVRLRRVATHLDATNLELEVRVEERTAELEAAVDALEKEVESRKTAEESTTFLAYHDILTGLPNRELLRDRVEQAVYHRSRDGDLAAVLFLDLDGFKQVNDTHGHAFGDEILRTVSQRLEQCVRRSDSVSRLDSDLTDGSDSRMATISRQGGDEFIMLLTRIQSPEDARTVARRVLASISEPFHTARGPISMGVSVGIAMYPQDGEDVEDLLKNADTAMYEAKGGGGGILRFFDERMHERVQHRHRIETELRKAIADDDLTLHYQPQVNLQTGEVTGLEALVRWNRHRDELVGPADFISVAEASSLIIEVGDWVIRRAARDAAALAAEGNAPRIAVNLSGRHFRTEALAESVEAVLSGYGLTGSALEVEVTESAMLENRETAVRVLESLRSIGIDIALDDFGTGYSSLSYLRLLPLDRVKIDPAFIVALDQSPEIVEAVIWMSHSIGLKVVAEGVELPTQLIRLREMKCDVVQGFLLSRPVPFDRIRVACEDAERECRAVVNGAPPDPVAARGREPKRA